MKIWNFLAPGILFLLSIPAVAHGQSSKVPAWLQDAAIYHIYPSTYKDSNGDGIGDLEGIRSKLDYIKELGFNTIWMSPVFCSPFEDGGYDITDFYRVDPRFGSNTDLVNLFNDAKAKGIRVLLDLVAGHTSDKHPWFLESKSCDLHLVHTDYYIWTDSKTKQPTKYVPSDGSRDGNYYMNYFPIQPALNYGFANPDPSRPWEQSMDAPGPKAVRQELKNIISFWMKKGASGFRVDLAYSLVKNDSDLSGTMRLWHEMRSWFDREFPQGVLLSEWSNPSIAIKGGFHIDLMIHNGVPIYAPMALNNGVKDGETRNCYFSLEGNGQKEFESFVENYTREYNATKGLGFPSAPTCSHDIWRLNNGTRNTPEQLKVVMAFFLTMPWPPIVYYGEELGMRNLWGLPGKEGSISPSGRNRSAVRTPMQWEKGLNAGFSTCSPDRLYLPIDSDPNYPNAAEQAANPTSQYHFVKTLLALRNTYPALGTRGSWELLSPVTQAYPMVYLRQTKEEKIIVVLNPSNKAVTTKIPASGSKMVRYLYGDKKEVRWKAGKSTDEIKVSPVSLAIIKL